jgi:AraC-like DNA-binding protein
LFSSGQTVAETEYTLPYIFENLGNKRVFSCEDLKDSFIPEEFNFLKNEKTNAKFGYEIAIRSSVLRIFSFVLRYWYESAGSPDLAANQKNLTAIRKIRQYVKENYVTVTLTDASNQCGLSYSYFSRIFNEYMKMSFSDYVNLIRVNNSLKLLSSTDLSITEIALHVGFSTTSYYIQVFKRLKGMSPGEFRKLLKA